MYVITPEQLEVARKVGAKYGARGENVHPVYTLLSECVELIDYLLEKVNCDGCREPEHLCEVFRDGRCFRRPFVTGPGGGE